MTFRSSKRAALAVLAIAALCSPLLLLRYSADSGRSIERPLSGTSPEASVAGMAEPPAQPPQQLPPLSQPAPAPVQAQAMENTKPVPQDPAYTPGHFPGVSVRHVPGTHVPSPPEGTERTVPESREVVLPDGRVFIGVTLDETWRVPLKAKTDR